MKIQHQTIFGNGTDGQTRGNCFSTAIACILDLPVEEVPHFCLSDDWRGITNVWLKDYGLFYLDVGVPADMRAEHIFEFAGYHVISGQGPRGYRHSVVGRAGKIVHDPHPSGDGLLTEEEYGFLIPVAPRLPVMICNCGHRLADHDPINCAQCTCQEFDQNVNPT